ncbi:MAG: sulfatase-like hydrolase/transferase [Armatimonadetes bacterium]|nr:sulfatase-like hydrolase/transferase [Armatimonadota bacterium]
MRRRLWRGTTLVFGPLCALLYPVLGTWSQNGTELAGNSLLRPLLVGLLLTLGLGGFFWVTTRRNPERAATLTATILLLFFSHDLVLAWVAPEVRDFLKLLFPHQTPAIEAPWVDISLLLTLSLVVLGVFYRVRDAAKLLTRATFFSGVLLGSLVPSLVRLAKVPRASLPTASSSVTAMPTQPLPSSTLPDLICIVLDGYGRQDVLQRLYGLDNAPFLQELEKRGFFIARKSRANYIQTPLALSSAFNLDYITPPARSYEHDTFFSQESLDKNRIRALLKPKGFLFISVPTGVVQTQTPTADRLFEQVTPRGFRLTDTERMLLLRTPLGFLLRFERTAFDDHRSRLLSALDTNLPAAAALAQPKFIFAHILAPHPPFVFGPKGEPRYPAGESFTIGDATDYTHRGPEKNYRQGYADQLVYLNQKVLEALDTIQKNATRPTVIVLMGDHGPRMKTDWQSLANTDINEVFYNLMAVATPDGKAKELLGESVTPINIFRLVLTRYFGQNLPRLSDQSYYSTLEKPYAFTGVTPQLGN